jgi:hypothetical protein
MFELVAGISILGIIALGIFTGRIVKAFLGIVLTILAFGMLGGMFTATIVSAAFFVYMIRSGQSERI